MYEVDTAAVSKGKLRLAHVTNMLALEGDLFLAITEPGMGDMLLQEGGMGLGIGGLRMPGDYSGTVGLFKIPDGESSEPISGLTVSGTCSDSCNALQILGDSSSSTSPTSKSDKFLSTQNLSAIPVDSLFAGLMSISAHARTSTAPPKLRSELHLIRIERGSQSSLQCTAIQTNSIPAVGIDKLEYNVSPTH